MLFFHSDLVWSQFPQLRALTMVFRGVANIDPQRANFVDTLKQALQTLDSTQEGDFPSIQAWRRAYSTMGLKPTQYRCAAEALLRRLRKDRTLPGFHPLVDVLNAESALAAIPIAAFDMAHIVDNIVVRPATGDEVYETFSGETETPEPGEIIFADAAGQAHSRRWVFRQSAVSVVRESSRSVLIVAEALHDNADSDLAALRARLESRATELGLVVSEASLLGPQERNLEFAAAA